jgi:hypothetical protein
LGFRDIRPTTRRTFAQQRTVHSPNNAPETPTDILSYRNVEMADFKIVMVMGIILKRIVTDWLLWTDSELNLGYL